MAPTVRLTDGSTTVTFNSGTWRGFTYFPSTPDPDAETVTETIEAVLRGTAAAVRSAVNDVEKLLDSARRRQERGVGARVWIEYQAVSGDGYYRSEVLDGRVQWDMNPMLRRLSEATPVARVGVHVTRRFYWEGALTQIPLASSGTGGTPGTAPATAYNNDDANSAQTNWLSIAGTAVAGVLPSPLMLEIVQAEASPCDWKNIYIANIAHGTPTMTRFVRGSQAVSGATASWSGSSDPGTTRYMWDLSDTLTGHLGGRYWRLLLVFSMLSASGVTVRPTVFGKRGAAYSPLWEGDEAAGPLTRTSIWDLGAVPLPPGGYDAAMTSVSLGLGIRCETGGSATLDFIQFTPTEWGEYRRIYQSPTFSLAQGEAVVDDGPEELLYLQGTGGGHQPYFRAFGPPVHVWPGRTQRLSVLFDEFDPGFVAGSTFTARAWHRPRRLTV